MEHQLARASVFPYRARCTWGGQGVKCCSICSALLQWLFLLHPAPKGRIAPKLLQSGAARCAVHQVLHVFTSMLVYGCSGKLKDLFRHCISAGCPSEGGLSMCSVLRVSRQKFPFSKWWCVFTGLESDLGVRVMSEV